MASDDSAATYATVGGPDGGQVSKFCHESGRKCVIFFSNHVENPFILMTWTPLRASQAGVHGGTVVRHHPVAMYTTLVRSEWHPSQKIMDFVSRH